MEKKKLSHEGFSQESLLLAEKMIYRVEINALNKVRQNRP